MITHENTLSERERYILNALTSDGDSATARRAQAILAWSNGDSKEQIAETTGLRGAQVNSLTRSFAQKRLEVFAPSSIERASRGLEGPITVEALLEKHKADKGHARYVASLALQIFDATASIHQLGDDWRGLLETGAMLHNIGSAEHDSARHVAGHDIILFHELKGISPRDRDILACLALFHRKKVKASRDPIFAQLDPASQNGTLALAAILRVADGLDFSQTQSTSIDEISVDTLVDAVIEGPYAQKDGRRANKMADLWREVLSPPFKARLADEKLPAAGGQKQVKYKTAIHANDRITRAGLRIASTQLSRVQEYEDKVRAGDGVDAVHDMRVATRRLRSAFRLLGKYYPNKTVKKLRGPLRELAENLGAVRDLDVMLENLAAYAATLTLEQQRGLDPLLADWQARRAHAHRNLVDFLDSRDYDDWIARMEDLADSKPDSSAPRVADVVPALVWKHYGAVRKYESKGLEQDLATLHELRIECKRLRYVLEFFSEALGEQTDLLLEPLIALQDHLGSLHDADMACHLVAEFIAARARYAERHGGQGTNLEFPAAYLTALQTRMEDLRSGFPERWQILIRPAFREALGKAVAAL